MKKLTFEEMHKTKTGKVSDKWESYLPFYDTLLAPIRDNKLNLLEIGVQNGGSLETWSKYFENAENIIGCDIDENCNLLKYDDPRVKVIVGDANNANTFNKISESCSGYDLIIDDGSHKNYDIITSFLLYFPMLRSNGIYIVEDSHTLYMNEWGGGILNESSAYAFFKKVVDIINLEFWSKELRIDIYFRNFFPLGEFPAFLAEGWIESIEFRNSLIILRKSAIPNINKIGNRIITGSEAVVENGVLNLK